MKHVAHPPKSIPALLLQLAHQSTQAHQAAPLVAVPFRARLATTAPFVSALPQPHNNTWRAGPSLATTPDALTPAVTQQHLVHTCRAPAPNNTWRAGPSLKTAPGALTPATQQHLVHTRRAPACQQGGRGGPPGQQHGRGGRAVEGAAGRGGHRAELARAGGSCLAILWLISSSARGLRLYIK